MELFLLLLTLPILGNSVSMPQGLWDLHQLDLSQRARAGIVGGEEAPKDEWPWQVSLRGQIEEDGLWKHFCGGSLIHRQWILTAASCFHNIQQEPSDIRVQLRKQYLYYQDELLKLSKIVVHSNFSFNNKGADIALLKLKEPANLSSHVQTVNLPTASQNFSGRDCWVTGWGNIKSQVYLPPPFPLKQVKVPILGNDDCDQLYHKRSTIAQSVRIIPKDMICAGKEENDICEGDSGGPLVCKVEDSWIQAGVASWVEDCGDSSDRPGVYTSVPEYVKWIKNNIQ